MKFQLFSIYEYTQNVCKIGQSYSSKLSFHVDPMTFPIMFPTRDLEWSPLFKQYTNTHENLSSLQYYSYPVAHRPNNKFDPNLFCGRQNKDARQRKQNFKPAQYLIKNILCISHRFCKKLLS